MVSGSADDGRALAVISAHLGRKVRLSDRLTDLVVDSLDMVSLLMELERVFEISVAGLGPVETVRDLVDLCARRQG